MNLETEDNDTPEVETEEVQNEKVEIDNDKVEKDGEGDNKYDDEDDDEVDEGYEDDGYGEDDEVGELISNTIIVNPKNKPLDTEFSCSNCFAEMDASKYGKITCTTCGNYVFRRNLTLDIQKFKSIEDKDLSAKYSDVIARINNNYIRRNFDTSFKYCLEAEKLAPREPVTWEYYALVEYFVEVSKPSKLRKSVKDILKRLRENIRICEANGVSKEKIDEIKAEVALNLTNKAKSKIGRYYKDSIKNKGNWKRGGLYNTKEELRIFDECYRLTRDSYYLKVYVEELSKPYKWMVKNDDGEILNLPSCGKKFQAAQIRERLIQKIEDDYTPPEIALQRIDIKSNIIRDSNDSSDNGIIYK